MYAQESITLMKFKSQYQNHLESGILAQKADNARGKQIQRERSNNPKSNKNKNMETLKTKAH